MEDQKTEPVTVGGKYGRWTVLENIIGGKNPISCCRCACGTIKQVQRGQLKSGKSKSCGCLKNEITSARFMRHGRSSSKAYKVFRAMQQRCCNPKDRSYCNYGGRGVRVEWATFEQFYADMGDPPPGMMIERLNNNGNYSSANCVWAGWDAQASNKRPSKRWTVHGIEYLTSKAAGAAIGVGASVINRRTNGYVRNGRTYAPWPGYSSRLAYDTEQKPLALRFPQE